MKNKNFLFLVIIVFLISSLGLFNFLTDPYEIFHVQKVRKQSFCPKNFIFTYMDTYKDMKFPCFVTGGSDVRPLFGDILRYKDNQPVIYSLVLLAMDKKDEYEILKYYLSLHPETETVFIVSSYYLSEMIYMDNLSSAPDNIFQKMLKKIGILYSFDTTKASFLKIKNLRNNKHDNANNNDINSDSYYTESQPYYIYDIPSSEQELAKAEKINFEYSQKIKNLLKEKNIKYKVIIPPYNAGFQYCNYINPINRKYIERYKRFLTENFEEVYDFAFINKYTSTKLYQKNYLYVDMYHISDLFGNKVFKYFFDENNSERDICIILNRENINDMLNLENNLMEKFISENSDFTEFYDKIYSKSGNFDNRYRISTYLKEMPSDALKEIEYLRKNKIK